MKKLSILTVAAVLAALVANSALALVRYEEKRPKVVRDIVLAGFLDYAPFGYVDDPDGKVRGRFHSVYEPMMDDFKAENNLKFEYRTNKRDYDSLVLGVRRGEIDILLGAYHETEMYRGLELVFPAIIDNPVTVFMLPHRVKEVNNTDDLQKLKGVRCSKEYYSDFVNEQLKHYNIEEVNTPYEMFESLFTGKADYIMGSQFYTLIQASKLGLKNQIAIARQTVWKMPMFIGVSKISKHRKMIVQKLTHYSENPANRKKMEESLIGMILAAERENAGVVPPTFGLEQQPSEPKREETSAEAAGGA